MMIHELLLCLSGHPSPLLEGDLSETDRQRRVQHNDGIRSLIDPAELVLLQKLSLGLGKRNRDVRDLATKISTDHPSTVCRAVAAAVLSTHLTAFRRRILEVERDILTKNSNIVGAHSNVPLSAVVSAFDGWERKLQWLLDLVTFILPQGEINVVDGRPLYTAADVIQRLRDAAFTGFPDIEAIAIQLTKVAELTWLKHIAAWVVYGRLPDEVDFFVRQSKKGDRSRDAFTVDASLVPCFVTPSTASSILFVGKSLNRIHERKASDFDKVASHVSDAAFLSTHLSRLSKLNPPITPTAFATAIHDIRLSLSQNALQKLLPIAQVFEVLGILKDFFLLERGEFAAALINAAENRLPRPHALSVRGLKGGNDPTDLASLTIRDGEVQTILSRAWTTLASLHDTENDIFAEELETARELVTFAIKGVKTEIDQSGDRMLQRSVTFDDLLLPSPTILGLRLSTPIDLFLSAEDIDTYSQIHSYLLALRRSHTHLSRLFLLSAIRREPRSSGGANQSAEFHNLLRAMRSIWITVTATSFILTEISGYFQGEVISNSWASFQNWVTPEMYHAQDDPSLPANSFRPGSSHLNSRPASSRQSDEVATWGVHDPDTLASAHRKFLAALRRSLLLHDYDFTSILRRHMATVDHLCGLMQRLNTIHTNLRAMSSNNHQAHHIKEDRTILADLSTSRATLIEGNEKLIARLRHLNDTRFDDHDSDIEASFSDEYFVPWTSNGLDRILLKFDFNDHDRVAFGGDGVT